MSPDPMPTNATDAETRVRDFVSQTIASGATSPEMLGRLIAQHERDSLAITRADLRALLASLATLREGMRLLNEEIDTVGNERDALREENVRLRADGERLDTLASLLRGADFDYGHDEAGTNGESVLLLNIPRAVRVGADLRAFADAARAPHGRTDDPQPARLGGTSH